jgi:hypothetical protein
MTPHLADLTNTVKGQKLGVEVVDGHVSLKLLHNRLGHRKCHTLLATNKHDLWNDTIICMSSDNGCLSCGITTIKSTARNKEPHTAASHPGEYVFLDISYILLPLAA